MTIGKHIRIAFLIVTYGDMQKEVLAGCKSRLARILPAGCTYEIDLFSSDGPYRSILDEYVKVAISDEYDIMITVGVTAAQSARQVTDKSGSKMPVVYTCLMNPVKAGLIRSYEKSYNNLVGISIDPPTNLLPAQTLLAARPEGKKFLVPLRTTTPPYQMLKDEIEQTQEYFASLGRSLEVYEISTDRLPRDLFGVLSGYDGVLIPEGGLTKLESASIVEYCDANNIISYSNGKDAIKQGAVFAVRTDLRYVGRLAADYVHEICVLGKKPTELSSRELSNARSLVYSFRNANKHGVSFSPELLSLFEAATISGEAVPEFDQLLKVFASYCQSNTPLMQDMIARLTDKIKTKITHTTGRIYSSEKKGIVTEVIPMPESISRLIERDYSEKLFIGGGEAVVELLSQMDKKGIWHSFDSIQIAPSVDDALGLGIEPQSNTEHSATVIEPVEPHVPLTALKTYMKRCDVVFLIVGLEDDELPIGYKEYMEAVRESAENLKVTLKEVRSTDLDTIRALIKKRAVPRNAVCTYPHLIRHELVEPIFEACDKYGMMFLAPSLRYAGKAPMALGLRKRSFDAFDISYKPHGQGVSVRFVDAEKAYAFCGDNRLIEQQGGIIAAKKTALLSYECHIIDDKNARDVINKLNSD